jgi:5-methylcytosine-specific restriction endonuclease McrA
MANEPLFFPRLSRRGEYRRTRSGGYYADYSEYKQEIREDCLGRCVYCDTHENETGGAESMELDHFRPKKYPEYANLINNPHNLV